ncbi:MAG: hypothetical protein ACYCYE_17875 [Clostridia bacterium]
MAKVIFVDELRNNQLSLSSISVNKKEIAAEWQLEYIRFVQGLSEERIKAIEECAAQLISID